MFGVLTTAAYLFAMLMVLIKPLRILLQWCLPPGTGPSKSVRDKGHFTEKFFGEGLTVYDI